MESFNLDREVLSKIGKRGLLYIGLSLCLLVFVIFYFFFRVPTTFKSNSTIRIQSGQSLISTAQSLKSDGIVSSSFWLTNLVILMGGEHRIVAGYYFFPTAENLFSVAVRLTHGDFGIIPIKVTIPEGQSVKGINTILTSKFNLFDSDEFYNEAKDKEGYLFPDTYFFVPTVLPEDVISKMSQTFDQKVNPLLPDITASGRSLNQVITMASILEGEATDTADRKIIAGIFWKRSALGIPLQADATLKYITGKASSELTVSDLKIDSPYNSYVRKGLPPTPISNPGLDSIEAAISPTDSDYLYFLSDQNGEIHYAKTLKEHDLNRDKYL